MVPGKNLSISGTIPVILNLYGAPRRGDRGVGKIHPLTREWGTVGEYLSSWADVGKIHGECSMRHGPWHQLAIMKPHRFVPVCELQKSHVCTIILYCNTSVQSMQKEIKWLQI